MRANCGCGSDSSASMPLVLRHASVASYRIWAFASSPPVARINRAQTAALCSAGSSVGDDLPPPRIPSKHFLCGDDLPPRSFKDTAEIGQDTQACGDTKLDSAATIAKHKCSADSLLLIRIAVLLIALPSSSSFIYFHLKKMTDRLLVVGG